MSMLGTFGVSASALSAERFRMDLISSNLANANTMRVGGIDPYRRKMVVLMEDAEGGVRIQRVVEDESPFREAIEPDNPYRDKDNKVYYSNVDPISEMVDMISASRAYEANIQAFNLTKQMLQSVLDIGRV
ncbi:MAG: Flagellar basal-body rod protein FlgC [Fimbriimonadales bacterium]|nr:Flagellar basal-body rod protein FlgC [Fimbriimonadales bacterium]